VTTLPLRVIKVLSGEHIIYMRYEKYKLEQTRSDMRVKGRNDNLVTHEVAALLVHIPPHPSHDPPLVSPARDIPLLIFLSLLKNWLDLELCGSPGTDKAGLP
jgi:hypothetical protein